MDKCEIRKQILDIANKQTSNKVNLAFENSDLKNYHIVSANLMKFMPEINPDSHRKIYESLLKMRMLENISEYFKTFDLTIFFKNLSPDKFCKDLPAIYISYHMGAYRTAILPMVKNNINIAIVVDSSIYSLEQIEQELYSHFKLAKEIFPTSTTDLKVLSSNDKSTVIEMMDKLHKGYSILTYIDWNSGYNNTSNNIVIDFFNEQVSVRQSIAYLSFYSKRPIVPFISYCNDDYEPNWILFEAIYPMNFATIHEYARYAMQNIYSNLQSMVEKHYYQWQGWFHIHKSIASNSLNSYIKTDFESDSFYKINKYAGLFIMIDSYFIINKISYKIIKLTNELYDRLFSGNYLDKDSIELSVLKQLYYNGMIEKE